MGAVTALYRAWLHEGLYILTRIAEKMGLPQRVIIRRRVLPDQGLVVAFLGPDGSGKSTVTKTITSQWEHKIDIACLYFGTGDGPQTFSQELLKLSMNIGLKAKNALIKKQPQKKTDNGAQKFKNTDKPTNPPLSTILYAIVGTLNKKQQMHRVRRLRNKGFLVICDRWPQNQVTGMNDGPFLSLFTTHDNFLYRALARWEEKQFNQICTLQQPDIVIRLLPSLETAISRKEENKEMSDLIQQKMETLKQLHFADTVEKQDVDADQALEKVLTNVRKIIWTHLQKREISKPNFHECLGLPGAGKTTLCKELYKIKNIKSVDDIFPPSKPMHKIHKAVLTVWSLISDPVIYALIVKIIFELKLWKNKETLNYLFRLPVQKLRLKKALKSDQHLIEQLLLQNIWSAFVSADIYTIKPECLAPFIAHLYRGIKPTVFYFSIPPDEAAKRVSQRKKGTSRFDNLPQEEIADRLNSLSYLMNDIVKASSYAGLEIVYIDASQPIEKNLKRIESQP